VSSVDAVVTPARGVAVEPALRAARDRGRKLLVTYMTGGLGENWDEYVQVMVEAGADAIEIGLPFSDPVMDGPTIQAASLRALQLGTNPIAVLETLTAREIPVPLVAMTYYNLVGRAGHHRFAQMLADAGVLGAIVPDLPLEESGAWESVAATAGLATILLAAPITPPDRLIRICERSHGFVYGVNLMGVTGERDSVARTSSLLASRLKAVTDKPVVMGFGISTPAQAVEAARESDGAVVASALMRAVLDGASPDHVGSMVAGFRKALDKG
jgi:tryptophan synthase alpha chain